MPRPLSLDRERSALVVVDLQYDFLPGGALAVQGGGAVVPPIAALVASDAFGTVVATQDWHPEGHVSFASQHPGRAAFETLALYGKPQTLWPDHCVQGSRGAALAADVDWRHADVIVRKGSDPAVDSYSGFRHNWNARGERPPTGLAGYLRERGVTHVYLCGLARDVCVRWSAEDAKALGFESHVLWELCRSVRPEHDVELRAALEASGVHVVDAARLVV